MTEPLELRIAPATIFAVDTNNNLLRFDSAEPGTIVPVGAITGLAGGSGEAVVAIDFRPATGQLFALGLTEAGVTDEARLYVLNPRTGAATQVGADGQFGLSGTDFGFDFNPVVDRIRVVSDANQNQRLNPNDGSAVDGDPATTGVQTDTNLAYVAGDPNAGANPNVVASAYTNNTPGATTTSLFGIDSTLNILVRQGGVNVPPGTPSPNGGQLFTIGALGVDPSAVMGFDVATFTGTAFAAMTVGGSTGLYSIDVATGAATLLGAIGNGTTALRGMSVTIPGVQILNATTATYVDEDGDRVTIKVSKGTLDSFDFQFAPMPNGGGQLRLIDFSNDGTEFDKANLTLTVKKAKGGDGFANVGFVKANGVDLGKVTIRGDLGQIDAGDADTATTGLAKLSVHSIGRYGLATQSAGGNLVSAISGSLGALNVRGDIVEASISVSGGAVAGNGRIGTVTIGGCLIGAAADFSGLISATGNVGSVKIGRDVIGRGGIESGRIFTNAMVGAVNIGGSVFGGSGDFSGAIVGVAGINAIKIGGSLIGGSIDGTESLTGSGAVGATHIGAITIGGSLIAGVDESTGALTNSGVIQAINDIGSVTIRGSIIGNASNSAIISAGGEATPDDRDVAIGKITVLGQVERARILAGWQVNIASNGNASIGVVKIGGDWIASDLVAGAQDDVDAFFDDAFGDADDIAIPGFGADTLIASIASVVIKGRVIGSSAMGDHFGFVAEQIGKFRAGGFIASLTSNTDMPIELSPITGDVTLREV